MKRKENPFLWALVGALMLAILGLALIQNNRARRNSPPAASTFSEDNAGSFMDISNGRTFFTRHIDTVTCDTMYFVCRLGPNGDTIPDIIGVTYPNDSVAYYRYYLNNQGDTVLMDYLLQHEQEVPKKPNDTDPDSLFLAVKDSVMNKDEQTLISAISSYLERIHTNSTDDTERIPDSVTDTTETDETDTTTNKLFNSIIVPDETEDE